MRMDNYICELSTVQLHGGKLANVIVWPRKEGNVDTCQKW